MHKSLVHLLLVFSLLLIIGFSVFANALSNRFVYDDMVQIVRLSMEHSLRNLPLFFISSIRNIEKHGIFFDFYYKPMMFVDFSLLYALGKGTALPFHLFQIGVFVCNSLLVYLILKKIFPFSLALFFSLLFLLHPINADNAVYIANTQDVLFFFFGMIALVFVIYLPERRSTKINMSFWLFLSLLSKESGILFAVILLGYIVLFEKQLLKDYVPWFVGVGGVYGVLRIVASQFYFISMITPLVAKTTLSQRLIFIPRSLVFYLQRFVLPNDSISQSSKILPHFSYFFSSLGILVLFLGAALYLGKYLMQNRGDKDIRWYGFFCLWLSVGLVFHLQLFPFDDFVQDRWFYFPFVGLVGILGFGIVQIRWRATLVKIVGVSIALVILIFCAQKTVQKSSYYRSPASITAHRSIFY